MTPDDHPTRLHCLVCDEHADTCLCAKRGQENELVRVCILPGNLKCTFGWHMDGSTAVAKCDLHTVRKKKKRKASKKKSIDEQATILAAEMETTVLVTEAADRKVLDWNKERTRLQQRRDRR